MRYKTHKLSLKNDSTFWTKSTIVFSENLSPRFKKRRNSVNDL